MGNNCENSEEWKFKKYRSVIQWCIWLHGIATPVVNLKAGCKLPGTPMYVDLHSWKGVCGHLALLLRLHCYCLYLSRRQTGNCTITPVVLITFAPDLYFLSFHSFFCFLDFMFPNVYFNNMLICPISVATLVLPKHMYVYPDLLYGFFWFRKLQQNRSTVSVPRSRSNNMLVQSSRDNHSVRSVQSIVALSVDMFFCLGGCSIVLSQFWVLVSSNFDGVWILFRFQRFLSTLSVVSFSSP